MTIARSIQKLDPGARVELFELDIQTLGGGVYYFHAGTNALREPIVWQTNEYVPWPIEAEGFEWTGQGQLPRPKLRIANIGGAITALAVAYDDLIGGKVTRRRTLAQYLDGEPGADDTAAFPDDVFYVERKVSENRVMIEYELSSSLDLEGVVIPLRKIVQNFCQSVYRSAECSYAGGAVADINDVPTALLANDNCSRRLSGCVLRFGTYGSLPFGAFPSVLKI